MREKADAAAAAAQEAAGERPLDFGAISQVLIEAAPGQSPATADDLNNSVIDTLPSAFRSWVKRGNCILPHLASLAGEPLLPLLRRLRLGISFVGGSEPAVTLFAHGAELFANDATAAAGCLPSLTRRAALSKRIKM